MRSSSSFVLCILSSLVLAACAEAPPTPPPAVATAAPPPSSVPEPAPLPDAGAPIAEADAAAAVDASPPESDAKATVLKKGLSATSAMTSDGNAIYWIEVEDGTLSRVSKRGGATNLLYTASAPHRLNGHAIAVDEANVFWVEDAGEAMPAVRPDAPPRPSSTTVSILKQDKNGGSASAVVGRIAGFGNAIALDDKNVYWIAGDGIWTAPKKGGNAQPLTNKLPDAPTSIAADGKHVYFTTSKEVVRMFPRPGSKPETVARDQDKPQEVTLEGDSVYWLSGPKLMASSKAKPDAKTIATADGTITDYAVFGDHVYWVGQDAGGAGVVMRAPTGGGAPEKVAGHQPTPIAIAVDKWNVYWATKGTEAGRYRDGALIASPAK